jgi:hypothetical protein
MEELFRSLRNFTKVLGVATTAHQLAPDRFDWLQGEVRHPMEPQPILAPWPGDTEAIDHNYFTSTVTVYGGRTANRKGDFRYGHVDGHISEPTPSGTKHQSNRHDPPVPYIARTLTIKDDAVTVRTPEKDRPVGQGPVVFEGAGNIGRWATVTCYDPRSGKLTVRSGNFITDGQGWWSYDRTVAEDAHQLPQAIVEARVATMARTLNGAADILEKVAAEDAARAKWSISRNYTPPAVW